MTQSIVKFSLIVLTAGILLSQDSLSYLGAGVRDPTIRVGARGEITTIFLRNAKTIIPRAPVGSEYYIRAQQLPVSSTLGGFSARYEYQGGLAVPAPILRVSQREFCGNLERRPECLITSVTIQIPFELRFPGAILTIGEAENRSTRIPLGLVEDHVHVLTYRDLDPTPPDDDAHWSPSSYVFHRDGSLVSSEFPAKPGEVVVIYATGLGRTIPAVPSGTASPFPTEMDLSTSIINVKTRAFAFQFDFRANAGPMWPYRDPKRDPSEFPVPEFIGLAPGQVGIYQINIKLPETFPPVPPCSEGSRSYTEYDYVFSNLTIQIAGLESVDGARLCVEPGPEPQ